MARTAVLAGWTGLVGQGIYRAACLSQAYDKVVLLQRRPAPEAKRNYLATAAHHPPNLEQRVVDFNHVSADDLAGADDVFCALGTTIKKAGSQAAFRKVDFDAIVNLACAAVEAGAKRFVLVSSIGADPKSKNFYLRVKGETEQAISALPFEAVHIMRPSLLLGHRQESRAGEAIARAIMPMLNWVLVGGLRKYRAIPAEIVAKAMVRAVQSAATGIRVNEYPQITALAER